MSIEKGRRASPLQPSTTRKSGDVSAPSHSANSGPFVAFVSAVERLEQVIEIETKILREHKPADLREFNHRKSHGLLELNRAIRALGEMASSDAVRVHLARLRDKLEKNRAVLRTHLQAVREIAATITRVIVDDDSDGTYSAYFGESGGTS